MQNGDDRRERAFAIPVSDGLTEPVNQAIWEDVPNGIEGNLFEAEGEKVIPATPYRRYNQYA